MADQKVNFGVIGAGGIALRKTIPGMKKAANCKLVAVMDPVGIKRIAAKLKVRKAYSSEAKLLADPEVEAVYIASPYVLSESGCPGDSVPSRCPGARSIQGFVGCGDAGYWQRGGKPLRRADVQCGGHVSAAESQRLGGY